MTRVRRFAVLGAVWIAGVGCPYAPDSDDTGEPTTETTSQTTSQTPTGGGGCVDAFFDCDDTQHCWAVDCVAGMCVYEIDAFYENDFGTPGDCKEFACDSEGKPVEVASQTDAPPDDKVCTEDRCDPEPVYEPLPPNSDCSDYFENVDAYCHPGGTCQYCKYVPPDGCDPDKGAEPNDTQETAYSLGTIDDADLFEGYVQCDVLADDEDVDWFVFKGTDDLLGATDPAPRLYTDGAPARVCMFFECDSGTTSIDCGDATPEQAPGGQKGCCDAEAVAPGVGCTNPFALGGQVWIRVDQGPAMCTSYELRYNF